MGSGVQLVRKGLIWRIRDGEKVDAWSYPWLLKGTARFASSPQGEKNPISGERPFPPEVYFLECRANAKPIQ
jgi:hypothetical protein